MPRTGNEMLTGTMPCAATGTVDISAQDQTDGRLTASVEAAAPGYVFLSEPFYPEREAFVDGRSSRLCARTSAFTAVPVPAGSHQVELRYTPDQFSCAASGLSVLTVTM